MELDGAMTAAEQLPHATPAAAAPTTDPAELLQLAEGMHAIEALTAAVAWLDVFEWLDVHPSDEVAVARALELAPRPAHVLLTLLHALRLVDVDANGVHTLTPLAREYLLRDSPWSLVPVFAALKDRPTCTEMLRVLRTGRPTSFGADGAGDWASGMDDQTFAELFLAATDSRNAYLAHAVAAELDARGFSRLLDVGGGSGIYACALAERNPQLRATVFEKPPVDAIARRAVAQRGLADRVDVVAGDMLDDALPRGYDAHLFSNVLHDWDEPQVAALLSASYDALEPGGIVVVHDALLDADGAGPLAVAQYSVLLMSFTGGRCYSLGEIATLLERAGFADVGHRPTVVNRDLVTGTKAR